MDSNTKNDKYCHKIWKQNQQKIKNSTIWTYNLWVMGKQVYECFFVYVMIEKIGKINLLMNM